MRVEKGFAIAIPPLVGLVSFVLVLALQEGFRDSSMHGVLQFMISSAVVLAAAIFLDVRAQEKFFAHRAMGVRLKLRTSALVTISALALIAAKPNDAVLYLCGPALLICGALLWFSIEAIQRESIRALILTGFVTATATTQVVSNHLGLSEEGYFISNSLLVTLLVGLRMVTWSLSVSKFG